MLHLVVSELKMKFTSFRYGKKHGLQKVKLCNCRKWKLRPSCQCAENHISFLWLLSQPFLQDCSLAASEVDLGEQEATVLCSMICWTYSVVTALASLLMANKGLFMVQVPVRGFCLPPSYTT